MLGLLGIAFCQLLGKAAGDKISRDCSAGSDGHKVAIGIGIVSLWLMNISVNVLMGPSRAIINDLVEANFLVRANSIATGAMGTPGICFVQQHVLASVFDIRSTIFRVIFKAPYLMHISSFLSHLLRLLTLCKSSLLNLCMHDQLLLL
jgi:hypothetical protein